MSAYCVIGLWLALVCCIERVRVKKTGQLLIAMATLQIGPGIHKKLTPVHSENITH